MKFRIIYSMQNEVFQVQTKQIFEGWETLRHYFYTDLNGDLIKAKGFSSARQAKEWVYNRYPERKLVDSDKNIIFNY